MAAIFALKGVFVFLHNYWAVMTVTMVRRQLQISLSDSIGDASYAFYTNQHTGHMVNILANETRRFAGALRAFGHVLVALSICSFTFRRS